MFDICKSSVIGCTVLNDDLMNGFDFDVFAAHHGSYLNMVRIYVANTRRQATVLKKNSHKNPCRTLFYTNFHQHSDHSHCK